MLIRRREMDERFLRDHAARLRSLAAKTDEYFGARLIALAERYEKLLTKAGRAMPNGSLSKADHKPPPVQRR
jgi:hypothetical protein